MARAARTSSARALIGVLARVAPPRGAFAVLTYHRVDERHAKPWLYPGLLSATPADFAEQVESLARYHHPLALPELLSAHRGETEVPPRSVLITFDDAYRDFRDNAWPVLWRRKIPVTLFVPTGYPDQPERRFWWDRLWHAVLQGRRRAAIETALGRIELGDDAQRRQAGHLLVEYHKSLSHADAMRGVDDICDELRAPDVKPDVLSWQDLRDLSAEGVHLAAHSRRHPLLTRIPRADVAVEVDGSRSDLERQLPGVAYGNVFAYPGGQHDDQSRSVLSELGFELAFTTLRGVNQIGRTDPLALRRFNVGTRSSPDLIRAQLVLSALRSRAVGR